MSSDDEPNPDEPDDQYLSSWRELFGRSRISPLVFPVHRYDEDSVLAALKKAGVSAVGGGGGMYSDLYFSWPLLDGVVIQRERYYGFPIGLPRGLRVVGLRPMRLLCALMGYKAPRRKLHAGDLRESAAQLRWALRKQLRLPEEILAAQASLGAGVSERGQLERLIARLYPDASPEPDKKEQRLLAALDSAKLAELGTTADGVLRMRRWGVGDETLLEVYGQPVAG